MQINFAHLCDYALMSDGKLSVLGIFTQIRPQMMPWIHPTFYLAYEIGLEPAEVGAKFNARVAIQDQDGKSLLMTEGEAEMRGRVSIDAKPTAQTVLCINGLPFQHPGPYQVVIWLRGEVKHTLRFEVLPLPSPPQASDA